MHTLHPVAQGTSPQSAVEVRSARREGGCPFAGRDVFMIGIGGSGMSGLARMLAARGARVRGSDSEESEQTRQLVRSGIGVEIGESGGIGERCDLVIASAAIAPEHPGRVEAGARGVPVLLYAQALGRCMQGRTGVCIAGTHGKSTTTAMLGCVLTDAGLDPTVIVGATCAQLERGCLHESGTSGAPSIAVGFRLGASSTPAGRAGLLVAESCEYNRSFHNFSPLVASISSVEADHLDVYGSLDAVVESFREFALRLPGEREGGRLLIAHDGAHRREVTRGVSAKVETIGFSPDADYVVRFDTRTRCVVLQHGDRTIARWTNTLAGAHNAFNASVALTLAVWLGADAGVAARSLSRFRGVDRRMQFVGEREAEGGVVRVFDDYGHHPTEVDVTLRAMRESERPEEHGGRLICVFQPHQHSRTRHLMDEFASSFTQADVVIVPDIYFVRDSEEERHRVTAEDLVERLRDRGASAIHISRFDAIVRFLEREARGGDVVVSMGAGPVWRVAHAYARGAKGGAA